MKLHIPIVAVVIMAAVLLAGAPSVPNHSINLENKPVAEVLAELGDAPPPHQPDFSIPGVSVENGRDLVLYGSAIGPDGKMGKRISRHFVCTACHNVQRDEPDLAKSDPQARLEFVSEKGLPYLPGSSLYGIVNRTSFYNGDYEKKYGSLVEKARNDLRQAIQLCATECSQGRLLDKWELESVLAYLWTIQLQMKDLALSEADRRFIEEAMRNPSSKDEAIRLIKSRYLQGMPATFVDPPADRHRNQPPSGNAENGRLLYTHSCLHCHENRRYSFLLLDESPLSLQWLDKHFSTWSRYSVYQVVRYGTSPVPWKRAYMPNYTLEKMSDEMLEDLRTYIHQAAVGGQ